MTHKSQVTRRVLSYEAIFFSSATVYVETFHFAKRYAVVREEGSYEGIFDREPAPPPPNIHNLTAPPSAPGDHIKAGVLNASNREKDIALVRNQDLEVYYDTEPSPNNVPLVENPADETLFEG